MTGARLLTETFEISISAMNSTKQLLFNADVSISNRPGRRVVFLGIFEGENKNCKESETFRKVPKLSHHFIYHGRRK